MTKLLKYSLFALALPLGTSTLAVAHEHHDPRPTAPRNGCGTNDNTAPEVDPSLAIGGITLLGGTIAVARARRRN